MTEAGFFEPKRISPSSLAIVIALHGAAITALALARETFVTPPGFKPTIVDFVEVPVDPPPIPTEPQVNPNIRPQHQTQIEEHPPIVDTNQTNDTDLETAEVEVIPWTPPGFETIRPPVLEQAARAKGDVRALFTADDYPEAARQRQESGSLRARLDIGTDGRVAGCSIVASSGSRSLDTAACRVLKARARFTPAKDSLGQPISDSYVTPAIVWKLVDA